MSKWEKTCSDLPGVKDVRLTEDQHALILDNMGLLWRCYHRTWSRLYLTEIEKELLFDLLQNKLIRAAQGFDKSWNRPFPIFATCCLKSGVMDFTRRMQRGAKVINYVSRPDGDDGELPLEHMIEAEETDPAEGMAYQDLESRVRRAIGHHDADIFIKRYVLGRTLKEVAKENGYSKERARQVLLRIKDNLRERLVAQ